MIAEQTRCGADASDTGRVPGLTHGTSSVGRALVSKTRCREFEPLVPCKKEIAMKKLKLLTNIEESYDELRYKTSWPTKKQLLKSAMIVLVASVMIALIIFIMDQVLSNIMEFVYTVGDSAKK